MLTMAHRLATMPYRIPAAISIDEKREYSEILDDVEFLVKRVAPRGQQIICDNIYDYAYDCSKIDGKITWDWQKDFPNVAPSFPSMVFQWTSANEPSELSDKDTIQLAVVMDSVDLSGRSALEKASILQGWESVDAAMAEAISSDLRWIAIMGFFGELNGSPFWYGLNSRLCVSSSGKPLLYGIQGTPSCASDPVQCDTVNIMTVIPLLALSFMHCKNVAKRDVTAESSPPAKWLRRQKCPEIKSYVLEIDPMKQVLRGEGGIETNGLKKALHICRGHFAHYTAEKPLFGKLTGAFFRLPHERGSKEAGEVKKIYKVKGDEQQEENP